MRDIAKEVYLNLRIAGTAWFECRGEHAKETRGLIRIAFDAEDGAEIVVPKSRKPAQAIKDLQSQENQTSIVERI
jgi:hypothetical protein